jgi:hypothetical protein
MSYLKSNFLLNKLNIIREKVNWFIGFTTNLSKNNNYVVTINQEVHLKIV